MVCPNCKSTDIVDIQNQLYCINCGQLISADAKVSAAPVAAAKPASVPVKANAASPKPRETEKASAQPVPQIKVNPPRPAAPPVKPSSLIVNHPTVSAPNINVKAINPLSKIPAHSMSKVAPLDLRSPDHKDTPNANKRELPKPPKVTPRMSDVRAMPKKNPKPIPADPKPSAKEVAPPKATKAASQPSKHTDQAPALRVTPIDPPQPDSTPVMPLFAGEGSAIVFAWRSLANWRLLVLAGVSSGLGMIVKLTWQFNVDMVAIRQAIMSNPAKLVGSEPLAQALRYGGFMIGAGLLLYLLGIWTTNAIIYALAKSADGRAAKWNTWIKAATESLWTVVELDLLLLPCLVLLGGMEWFVLRVTIYGTMSPLTQGIILLSAHLILMYLLLGLAFTRLFGMFAIVLGDLEATAAFSLASRLYRRRTMALAVAGAVGLVVAAIFIVPPLALGYANRDLTPEINGIPQTIASGLVSAGLMVLATVFIINYFYKHYRRSVLAVIGRSKPQLFAGRQPQVVSLGSKVSLGVVAAVAVAIGVLGMYFQKNLTSFVELWLSSRF